MKTSLATILILFFFPFYTYCQGSFKLIKIQKEISKKNHSVDTYNLAIKKNGHLSLIFNYKNEIPYLRDTSKHTFPRNDKKIDSVLINKDNTLQITSLVSSIFATQNKFLSLSGELNRRCIVFLNTGDTLNLNQIKANNFIIQGDIMTPENLTTEISNSEIQHFSTYSLNFKSLKLSYSRFSNLELTISSISKLLIIDNTKIDTVTLHRTFLPDTIKLINLDLTDMKGYFDFTNLPEDRKKNTMLIVGNVDIEKLKIPYDKFTVLIDDSISYEQKIILYQKVLSKLKEKGLIQKFEVMDKAYQQVILLHNGLYLKNIVEKGWWDYGYNLPKILSNSFIIFSIFFLINLLFYDYLITVYLPENFEAYNKKIRIKIFQASKLKKSIIKAPGVFLYTAALFWGVKLNFDKIKITNLFALTLLLFEYITGLICLGYIIHYVIKY